MKALNLCKRGGGQTPNPNFFVSILVILKENPGDGLGRVIPIFGFFGGSTKNLDKIHTFNSFLNEDLPNKNFSFNSLVM